MSLRVFILILFFIITVLLLLFLSLFVLVKRHTKTKDSYFLSRLKVFLGLEKSSDSIGEYFTKVDKILKYFLKSSSNYKYELPWYLSFGSAQSGKTSFFSCIDLDTPIQIDENDTSYINHYFFNEGIVLDIKSSLIHNDLRSDFCWERLTSELGRVRPLKGLDGIIYFVSLKDLLDTNPDTVLKTKKETEFLYQRLWQLQAKLNIKLPIYVVFTHLDSVDGFQSFLNIFEKYHDDIFGWSNSFSLETPFSPDVLVKMKQVLNDELKVLLSDVMVSFNEDVSFNIMNFIYSFQSLYPKISDFLSLTFQNNKYTKGFYFRGAYFTSSDVSFFVNKTDRVAYLENGLADVGGGAIFQESKGKVFFAKELLVNKIFAEKDIGREDADRQKTARDAFVLKCVWGCFSACSCAYSMYFQNQLYFLKDNIYPKMLKIVEIMKDYEKDPTYSFQPVFIEELKVGLIYLSDISNYRLRYYGVPSSLFSSLELSKRNLVLKATKTLVLQTLFRELESRYKNLSKSTYYDSEIETKFSFLNPLYSEEFKRLYQLVNKISELEGYELKFLSFKETGSSSNLAALSEGMLDLKIPDQFMKSLIFLNGFDLAEFDLNKLYNYKKEIKKKFRFNLQRFIVNCFSRDNINQYFSELQRLLFLIESGDSSMSYDNLQNVQKSLSELITLFNDTGFSWLRSINFSSPEFEDLLSKIFVSTILGGEDTVNEVLTRTTTAFIGFKKGLSVYILPIIGCPFYLTEDGKVQISDSVLELQGTLNEAFSESFMENVLNKHLPSIADNESLLIDVSTLKSTLALIKDFEAFEGRCLASGSKLDLILRNVAKQNLSRVLHHDISESLSVVTLDYKSSHLSDLAENIKGTNDDFLLLLTLISKLDINLFRGVKDLRKVSLVNFLTHVDKAMQNDNLYEIKEDSFLLDIPNKKIFFNFNIRDYLEAQKKQIEFYTGSLVEPVIVALDHIFALDNVILPDIVVKWKDIDKNIKDYKINPSNSKLFLFEELANKVQTSSLKDLFQRDLKKGGAQLNKDSFFETKVFLLSQRINSVVDASIEKILAGQYEVSLLFYKEFAHAFPFNLNGVLIGVSGYNRMEELIRSQEDIIALVKIARPNYDSPVFRFIENLKRLSVMISFLMSKEKCMNLKFKTYKSLGDLYEKNIHLLVNCQARVNGQKSLEIYKEGDLKIYDVVDFEISLAKGCGKYVIPWDMEGCRVERNKLILHFTKQSFMKFLMENVVEIDQNMFIRFTIDIEDDQGEPDKMVIMVPIELSIDGVIYTMPDSAFIKISEV